MSPDKETLTRSLVPRLRKRAPAKKRDLRAKMVMYSWRPKTLTPVNQLMSGFVAKSFNLHDWFTKP